MFQEDKYWVDWYVEDESIYVTMTLKDYDISEWPAGERGIYMAFGFGTQEMDGSDCLACYMAYYGAGNETFICTELTLGYGVIDAWWDPDEITSYKDEEITINGNTATFSVSVVRPLAVTKSGGYFLEKGKTHDVNWAYGEHYPTSEMPLW